MVRPQEDHRGGYGDLLGSAENTKIRFLTRDCRRRKQNRREDDGFVQSVGGAESLREFWRRYVGPRPPYSEGDVEPAEDAGAGRPDSPIAVICRGSGPVFARFTEHEREGGKGGIKKATTTRCQLSSNSGLFAGTQEQIKAPKKTV